MKELQLVYTLDDLFASLPDKSSKIKVFTFLELFCAVEAAEQPSVNRIGRKWLWAERIVNYDLGQIMGDPFGQEAFSKDLANLY